MSDNGSLIIPEAKSAGGELVKNMVRLLVPLIPPGIVARQFIVAVMAEANNMRDCEPYSVLRCAINAATIGLIPGPALGHAHFIPYKMDRGKNAGKTLAQLVVGYKGMLDLAYGCDFLKDIHPEVVLAGEKFRMWVDAGGPQIEHELPLERNLVRQNVVGAYCLYHTVAGGHGISAVNRKELDKIDTGKNVWRDDYVAMCKKTPIRRASKEWRITHRLGLAVRLDEQAEIGVEQESAVEIESESQPKRFSLDDIPAEENPETSVATK